MSITNLLDGTSVLNDLFQAYDWQKDIRRSSSSHTAQPGENILFRTSVYPPATMFESEADRVKNRNSLSFSNNRERISGFKIYDFTGKLNEIPLFRSLTSKVLISILIDDSIMPDLSVSEKKGEVDILVGD